MTEATASRLRATTGALRLLLVDDAAGPLALLAVALQREGGVDAVLAQAEPSLVPLLSQTPFDLILWSDSSDLTARTSDGAIALARQAWPESARETPLWRLARPGGGTKSPRASETATGTRRGPERALHDVLEGLPEGVLVTRDGKVIYANEALARIAGYGARDAILGVSLDQLRANHEGTSLRPREPVGASPTTEWPLVRGDGQGQVVVVESFDVPISFQGEACTLTVVRDVSRERELARKMAQMDRMIAVGTLAAGVGHEINNPLNYIVGNLSFVREELAQVARAVSGPIASTIERIDAALLDAEEGARRVTEIVQDLRTFSRGNDDEVALVDVERAADSAISMAKNEISHRARLIRTYASVPRIQGSASRLAQVVLNLLVNAAHAVPEGDYDHNCITVTTRVHDGLVKLEVKDTGVGVSSDVQEHIFEPFVTTKPVGQGTGLGLSISHNIVKTMGGKLTFVSEPGKGSTFTVSLPAVNDRPATSVSEPALRVALPRAEILLVDDEVLVGRSVVRALAREHTVTHVDGGHAALRMLKERTFDVIITDLMMPQMTGIDLCRAIAREHPDMVDRIVLLTGGAFTPEARSFLASSTLPQLEKPLDFARLRKVLTRILRKTSV